MKKHLLFILAIFLATTSCKETLCENGIYPFCEQEEEPVTPGTFTEKALCPNGSFPAVFSLQGKGYMGTGGLRFPPHGGTNQFYAYDPSKDEWTSIASIPASGRLGAVAFATDSKGYVGGGYTYTSLGDFKDFWEYDPIQNTWTQKADLPGGEGRYVGFNVLNKGYVAKDNKLWVYHPGSNSWELKGDFPLSINTVMFSIGPLAYAVNEGILWEYNSLTNDWRTLGDFPGDEVSTSPGNEASAAFATTTKGYVLNNYAVWEYNPISNLWYERGGIPHIGKDAVLPPTGPPSGVGVDVAFEVNNKGYFKIGYRGFAEHFYEYDPSK